MPNLKITLLILLALAIFAGIMLATSPKATLVVDGKNNVAYTGAINKIYTQSLKKVSDQTARFANSYIADRSPENIVLLNPTIQNIVDFYELAQHNGARLIIGSTPNETELKSKLFEISLNNKKVKFQTNQDWDPNNYENIGKGYTY